MPTKYFRCIRLGSSEDMERLLANTKAVGECMFWQGATNNGYGKVRTIDATGKRRPMLVHRLVCDFVNGPLTPTDVVRHACDNPLCVNPVHLSVGTFADNVKDRVSRGRSAIGDRNGRTLLGDGCVRLIRMLVADGIYNPHQLAKIMGVDYKAVWNALNGKTYAHLVPQDHA